jgi:hypothetical protein
MSCEAKSVICGERSHVTVGVQPCTCGRLDFRLHRCAAFTSVCDKTFVRMLVHLTTRRAHVNACIGSDRTRALECELKVRMFAH